VLGNGENIAFIFDRGGRNKIAQITPTESVKWDRRRDDISEATVKVINPSGDCCTTLNSIAVGRHELVIYRNGDRVWEGPITRTTHTSTGVEIVAHDICHYLSRTIMHSAYDNRYAKNGSKVGLVTTRMTNILLRELARKEALSPPVNILPYLTVLDSSKGAKTSRYTHAYQRTVWEEMDSLAWRAGMDYTTVGRRLILNDVHHPIGYTPLLSQAHFVDELIVTTYGMELATRTAVTDGEGHWAATGGNDPFYGEVELLANLYDVSVRPTDPTKPTAEELKAMASSMLSQAQRNRAGRYPVPVVVRIPDNSALDPSAPLTIDQLVAGVRVPLRVELPCVEIQQEQKLDRLTVTQDSKGETITVVLSPSPGSVAWDDEMETSGDDIGEVESEITPTGGTSQPVTPSNVTLIVVAPHPDDETLYLSGYISYAKAMGMKCTLIAVTDGGASGAKPAGWSKAYLEQVRRSEQKAAWSALTKGTGTITHLGLEDGAGSALTTPTKNAINAAISAAGGPSKCEVYTVEPLNDSTASADHKAVSAAVAACTAKVKRYSLDPRDAGTGTTYMPASTEDAQEAYNAYRVFGWTSVRSAFDALKASGYRSRIRSS